MADVKLPAVTSLSSVVADMLKTNGVAAIEEKVAQELFDREIAKRSDAIVKVMDLIQQEKKDLAKVDRPDNTTYGKDRKVVSESYSKTRLDEIEKKNKRIQKLEQAVNKSLEKNEHGDLYQAASGKLKDDDAGGADRSAGGDEVQG